MKTPDLPTFVPPGPEAAVARDRPGAHRARRRGQSAQPAARRSLSHGDRTPRLVAASDRDRQRTRARARGARGRAGYLPEERSHGGRHRAAHRRRHVRVLRRALAPPARDDRSCLLAHAGGPCLRCHGRGRGRLRGATRRPRGERRGLFPRSRHEPAHGRCHLPHHLHHGARDGRLAGGLRVLRRLRAGHRPGQSHALDLRARLREDAARTGGARRLCAHPPAPR